LLGPFGRRAFPDPPREALRVILDLAWRENAAKEVGLGPHTGWAHRRFNEVVGEFVVRYYRRHGVFPIGWHYVRPRQVGSRPMWFRPPDDSNVVAFPRPRGRDFP
jgi:hypothetical protein